jgi:hypothetical protein
MPILAGDIIYVTANFVNPKKPKYLICICPIKFYYMVINSELYRLAAQAQLQVTVQEISCLEHTSYIDTSKLIKLSEMETETPVEANPGKCKKGALSAKVRAKIVALVAEHGIMPKHQADLVAANLLPSATKPRPSGGGPSTGR